MADTTDPSHSSFSYETSPQLFLFTSLTAGSSHIVSATSRLETILKANRIPFLAIDCATDEKARRIWSRRSGTRKLPGLVREGMVLADLETVEEWNEYGELKERLSAVTQPPSTSNSPAPPRPAAVADEGKENVTPSGASTILPIREAPGTTTPSQSNTVTIDTSSTSAIRSAVSSLPPVRSVSFRGSPAPRKGLSVTGDVAGSSRGTPSGSGLATPEEPMTASAGPARKSGLEAITSHPDTSDAVIAVEQQQGRLKEKERVRGRARSQVVEDEDDADGLTGMAGKEKAKEDQAKGDARDETAAGASVGD